MIYDGASLDEWDDTELLMGRKRNKHGTFTGRPPLVIPAALHKELTRRRFSRAHDIMAASLVDGAQMLRAIVNDESADAGDRIKAAELMFTRVLGKPREQVQLDVSVGEKPRWETAMENSIVSTLDEVGLLLERRRAAEQQKEEDIAEGVLVEDDEDE